MSKTFSIAGLLAALATATPAAAGWLQAEPAAPSKSLTYWNPATIVRNDDMVEFETLVLTPGETKANNGRANLIAVRLDCGWRAQSNAWIERLPATGNRNPNAKAPAWDAWRFLFDDDAVATIARQACHGEAPQGGMDIAATMEEGARRLGYADAADAFTHRPKAPLLISPAPMSVDTPVRAQGAGASYDLIWSGPQRMVLTSPAATFADKKKDKVRGRSIWTMTSTVPENHDDRPAYAFRDFEADCRDKTIAIQTVRRWPFEASDEEPGPALQKVTEPAAPVVAGGPTEAIWASACTKRAPLETIGDARRLVARIKMAKAAAPKP